MPKAIWNGVVIAESETYESVEGNVYFPPEALKSEYFKSSDYHTTCGWKGVASYYNLEMNGQVIPNGAWYYPDTKPAANNIKNYVAFWKGKGVTIEP
jgi:uncharacterized protein (DUF427 family)